MQCNFLLDSVVCNCIQQFSGLEGGIVTMALAMEALLEKGGPEAGGDTYT